MIKALEFIDGYCLLIGTLIANIIIHQNKENYKSKNEVITILGDKIILENILIFYKIHNFGHVYGKNFLKSRVIYAMCIKQHREYISDN